MEPRFPLSIAPTCRSCGQPCSRNITGYQNSYGNAGRPYYTCQRHSRREFGCFDDAIGVVSVNPTCNCGYISRQTRRNRGSSYFYSCAVGACGWSSTDSTPRSSPAPKSVQRPDVKPSSDAVDALANQVNVMSLQPDPPRATIPGHSQTIAKPATENKLFPSVPVGSVALASIPAANVSFAFGTTASSFKAGPHVPPAQPSKASNDTIFNLQSSVTGQQVPLNSMAKPSLATGATTAATLSKNPFDAPADNGTFVFGASSEKPESQPKLPTYSVSSSSATEANASTTNTATNAATAHFLPNPTSIVQKERSAHENSEPEHGSTALNKKVDPALKNKPDPSPAPKESIQRAQRAKDHDEPRATTAPSLAISKPEAKTTRLETPRDAQATQPAVASVTSQTAPAPYASVDSQTQPQKSTSAAAHIIDLDEVEEKKATKSAKRLLCCTVM